MLSRLRKSNEKGFTLIELMIVIAIIGILAAIAIPNFISYRNKSYCSATESDANMIAAAIADYYAIPSRVGFPPAIATDLNLNLSNNNVGNIAGTIDAIVITVQDGSGRCPADYQTS
ncbi:MAG: prepilin-type N-terminal cleavage/methylation domain-containing protein [Desulfobacterales bacterium]|nr:prepilin-type N-terminal cleavage/methylation domain-containing protein [Desulfobacterales bacterium]